MDIGGSASLGSTATAPTPSNVDLLGGGLDVLVQYYIF